tara:strand:- start:30 stop:746 length:717 start_codon:yes stop_codon:yes gene_type:complete
VKRLGVNIDHIATLRNARGEQHPDPISAAVFVRKLGADSITIHLREDRRHIKDFDAKMICSKKNLLVNLEISTNPKIVNIALRIKPNFICIVPENRKEITTEGGLNLKKNKKRLQKIINQFKKKKIRTSLFINPSLTDVKTAIGLKTDCIEIHTGKFANLIKSKRNHLYEIKKIKNCAIYAKKNNLEVHAGHGLDYKSTQLLSKINQIEEFNIGHFLIGEAIFDGLPFVIKRFKRILR